MTILKNINGKYVIQQNNAYLQSNMGVYKFFVTEDVLKIIISKLGLDDSVYSEIETLELDGVTYYCVYVGQTKSKKGFYGRIVRNHLNGTKRRSTLRKSLEGVLKDETITLNEVYADKSIFVIIPENDKSKIDDLEYEEINKKYYRMLNLDGNRQNCKGGKHYSAGKELKRLRK